MFLSDHSHSMYDGNLYTERKNWQLLCDKTFYHTNYGVVQGFPALRKAVTTLLKKIRYFFTCVWYRQSAAERHTPFTPLGQVDEWTVKPSPFSIQCRLSEYFRIMSAKKTEIFVSTLTESDVQTFLEREENQNTKWKTENNVFSGFGNGISRGCRWKICHRPILAGYLNDFLCR